MSFVRDLLFGSPPDPNPGLERQAQASERVGLEQVALGREQLAYQKERSARTDAITADLVRSNTALMDTQRDVAQREYRRYQDTYVPLETQVAEQARDFDTESQRERYAIQAGADVAQAARGAAGQTLRSQGRLGLRPNADAFAAVNSRLEAQNTGMKAGAMTNARYAARDAGLQMKMNAINVGKGLPGTASTAATGAVNAAGSSSGMMANANNAYNAGAASANSFTNTGLNFMNSASNSYNAMNNFNLNRYQIGGQMTAAILNAGGMMLAADGGEATSGKVSGPGTGISDSIPARLSDGEYVIPADVVKAKGVEFFDKLLAKYHMPAEEQKRRYGIGGR